MPIPNEGQSGNERSNPRGHAAIPTAPGRLLTNLSSSSSSSSSSLKPPYSTRHTSVQFAGYKSLDTLTLPHPSSRESNADYTIRACTSLFSNLAVIHGWQAPPSSSSRFFSLHRQKMEAKRLNNDRLRERGRGLNKVQRMNNK